MVRPLGESKARQPGTARRSSRHIRSYCWPLGKWSKIWNSILDGMSMAGDKDRHLFQTERLSFRDWTAADGDALQLICADDRVMQFVGNGQTWSRDETERFMAGAIAMRAVNGYCQWALVHRADRRLVGFCGFVPASGAASTAAVRRKGDEGLEIGWRLAVQYWGQGLASEAARAALRYGFETLGCRRIIATVQAANQASIRVAEKVGMAPERRILRGGREVIVFSAARETHQARA